MEAWIAIFFVLGIEVGMLLGAGLVFFLDNYFEKKRLTKNQKHDKINSESEKRR
jgi:hypothetical protein